MKRIAFIFCGLLLILPLLAQERTVSGVVYDGETEKEPLIGATVSTVGGKGIKGMQTDENGRFRLSVSSEVKSLLVRYLGYLPTTVKLQPGVQNYEIKLMPNNEVFGEVVVTGYQKIDRRKLTASVASLQVSDEVVGAVKSVDQALVGQIAGLSTVSANGAPGAPVKIRIRGTASISGTQEPLWVLDGMPLEGTDIPSMEDLKDIDNIYQTSIAGINPSDIENITVLKDAAATAIYGARAANGVIVITTKKGKEGRPIVNFSSKITLTPTTDIKRINLLNANEKVDLELALLSSDYKYRANKGAVARILAESGETATYATGGWTALSSATQARIDALRGINTDWNDVLFRSVINQEYNVSLSGGSERTSYYSSVGYHNQSGTVKGVENNRFNLTLKGTYSLNKILKVGASVFANQREQESFLADMNGFTNPVYYSRLANPYFQLLNGNAYNYDTNVQGKEDSSLDFNILEERNNTSNRRTDRALMSIFDAELKLNDFLKLTTQMGVQYDQYTLKKYAGHDSYAMRKEKLFATFSFPDGKRSILPDGGMHKVTEYHNKQWTWKAMLEFARRFNQIHDLELMGGTEVRRSETEAIFSAAYGYDNRTLTTQPVLFPSENIAELYPLYKETHQENAFVSWFATGSYTLSYRYTLGGSIRFDGSDVFGVAKKYRYLPLYSVSALWRAAQEPFVKRLKWINDLSFRASYGLQGNIDKNTSPYLIGTFDRVTILPGTPEKVIEAENAPNPDLRWEKTKNINLGFNLSVLDNAITFTLDHYYRRSTDLIGMRMLPLETGFSMTTINWASMENRGWEIAIATRNVKTKHFKWTTQLNLGFNTNKVLKETVAENSTYPGREGYPIGAVFAYKTAGLDAQGYPLFVNAEGNAVTATEFFKLNRHGASTLTAEQQRALYSYVGTTDPKCSGGFNNSFEYKNWQLHVNFMFNLGMKVRVVPSYSPTNYDRGLNTNRDILNRRTPTNPAGLFPSLMVSTDRPAEYIRYSEYNLYSMLDTWVRDNNYLRLQSLRLAYKFEPSLLSKWGISGLSVSLEGRNLWVTGSDYHNYLDPETMGNPFAQPIPKSVIFGLNMNF